MRGGKIVLGVSLFFAALPLRPINAAPSSSFTYQGSVKQNGTPLNGTYPMEFRITNADGSAVYWTSGQQSVVVQEGLYRVELGAGGVDWANVDPYVETKINGVVFLPREKMTSTPYSFVTRDHPSVGVSNGPVQITTTTALFNFNTPQFSVSQVSLTTAAVQLNQSSVTLQGNTFNAANKLAQLDPSGALVENTGSFNNLLLSNVRTLPIVQIQAGTTATEKATTSTSYVDSNLVVNITPKFASSKILIISEGMAHSDGSDETIYSIFRGKTDLAPTSAGFAVLLAGVTEKIAMFAVDAPGTTTTVSYRVRLKSLQGFSSGRFTFNANPTSIGAATSQIFAIEVAQ